MPSTWSPEAVIAGNYLLRATRVKSLSSLWRWNDWWFLPLRRVRVLAGFRRAIKLAERDIHP
jgi:hypothetical protein